MKKYLKLFFYSLVALLTISVLLFIFAIKEINKQQTQKVVTWIPRINLTQVNDDDLFWQQSPDVVMTINEQKVFLQEFENAYEWYMTHVETEQSVSSGLIWAWNSVIIKTVLDQEAVRLGFVRKIPNEILTEEENNSEETWLPYTTRSLPYIQQVLGRSINIENTDLEKGITRVTNLGTLTYNFVFNDLIYQYDIKTFY